jgi:hypothetical protein
MQKRDNLKFQGGAATTLEREQGNESGKSRDHDHDDRTPVSLRITDSHGQAFETITAKAMKNAMKVSETNLNWKWTTECGTAAYCAWYVGN